MGICDLITEIFRIDILSVRRLRIDQRIEIKIREVLIDPLITFVHNQSSDALSKSSIFLTSILADSQLQKLLSKYWIKIGIYIVRHILNDKNAKCESIKYYQDKSVFFPRKITIDGNHLLSIFLTNNQLISK